MLLKDPMRVEPRCSRRWSMLVAVVLVSLSVLAGGLTVRAEAAEDGPIVIIINPDHGAKKVEVKGEKTDKIRLDLDSGKVAKDEVLLLLHRGVAGPDGKVRVIQEKLVQGQKTPEYTVEADVIVFEVLGEKDRVYFYIKKGDNLDPLRDALKRLEQLKKDGKLTEEAIRKEIGKALVEMKAQPMSPDQPPTAYKEYLKALETFGGQAKTKKYIVELEKQKHLELLAAKKPRLGVSVEPVPAALADHLGLAKDVGMVVTDVIADTPAAKAGVKVNDILVKISGAMVPSDVDDFLKLIAGLKGNTPLDVQVIRKGQMMTISGVKLAEAPTIGPMPPPKTKVYELQDGSIWDPATNKIFRKDAGKDTVTTTVTQSGNKIAVKYREGAVSITIHGTFEKGQFQLSDIEIADDEKVMAYASIALVPAQFRSRAQSLVQAMDALGKQQ